MRKITIILIMVFATLSVNAQVASITATPSYVGVSSAIVDIVPDVQANHPYSCCILYGINSINEYATLPIAYQFGSVWPVTIHGLIPGTTYLFQGIIFDSTGTISSPVGSFTTGACPLDASFMVGSGGPCFVELNAVVVDPSLSYRWLFNGVEISGANSPQYTAKESGNYQMIVWNAECTMYSLTIWVNVPSLLLEGVCQSTVCEGEKGTVSMSGANNYQWEPAEYFIDPNAASTSLDTKKLNGLIGKVKFFGTGWTGDCSSTISFQIEVLRKPEVFVYSAQNNVCESTPSVLLIGSPEGGTFSGVGVSGNKFSTKIAGPGHHEIFYSYTNSNGCVSNALNFIDVIGKPIVVSWEFHDNTLIINGSSLKDATVTVGNMVFTPVAASDEQLVFTNVFIKNGDLVIIKNGIDCFTTLAIVGLAVDEKETNIKIFPNPFSDFVNVEIPAGKYQVSLMNSLGESIGKFTALGNFRIDKNLNSGFYLLKIDDQNGNQVIRKIIKK